MAVAGTLRSASSVIRDQLAIRTRRCFRALSFPPNVLVAQNHAFPAHLEGDLSSVYMGVDGPDHLEDACPNFLNELRASLGRQSLGVLF